MITCDLCGKAKDCLLKEIDALRPSHILTAV
jgi:hypothetical protein